MNRSESINELATALAKAQSEMAGAKKDAENLAFKRGDKVSKYADLASVWEAARPALTKYGLSVMQFTVPSERNEMQVETTVLHMSGQWASGIIAIPVDKLNAHGYASALTYCRRLGLAAAVGIAPEEDDDGNAAVKAAPAKADTPPRGSAREVLHDEYQALDAGGKQAVDSWADEITDRFRRSGVVDAVDYLESLNLDSEHSMMMALWLKLKSDVRSPIKVERQKRREKTPEPRSTT